MFVLISIISAMNIKKHLPQIDPSAFNHRRYCAGTIHEIINGPCRGYYIKCPYAKEQLQKYAIGWCRGGNLFIKPKKNEIAILCFKDRHLWFHMREDEFIEVFCK